MLLTVFLACVVDLVGSTLLLRSFGHRSTLASRPLGLLLGTALAIGSGETARYLWNLQQSPILGAEALLVVSTIVAVALQPLWNPFGQAFAAASSAAVFAYLAFAAEFTFAGGLSRLGTAASAVLLGMEFAAAWPAALFAFETCDVLCRTRWLRPEPRFDAAFTPRVSLQVPAYNEPPDMLIETIGTLEKLDYPDFEIVVIDNNTTDPAIWEPVARWCQGRERVRFVHVEGLRGFKAGALNLALRQHTDPSAAVIGVVDADYLVDPDWLRRTVGYFADPAVGFVQTPQDYRDHDGNAYLTACYDAYRYFFALSMPSRNERDAIIFAGTMGLIRRQPLEELGGWDEWNVTEDSEASLRLQAAGWSGWYVPTPFGQGLMPLSFGALKRQRFRWCFGGMQLLRQHWKQLLPWSRNHLSAAQRMEYLNSGIQWLNDLIYLAFTGVLLTTAASMLITGRSGLRPLIGPTMLLPLALVATGIVRALWSVRVASGITYRRALLAFASLLALSWTVGAACVQGLVRSKGMFLRTPKEAGRRGLLHALRAARTETILTLALWTVAGVVAWSGWLGPLLVVLLAWQGMIYGSAILLAWLSQRGRLSPQLERRRGTEWLRDRAGQLRPWAGVAAGLAGLAVLAALLVGAQQSPGSSQNPYRLQHASTTPGTGAGAGAGGAPPPGAAP